MEKQRVLHIDQLHLGYRSKNKADVVLAEGLTQSFYTGELTTILGVNGIGKSTLIRTLTGLQQPLSGRLFLGDQKLDNLSDQERAKRLSLVLTRQSAPPNLLVREVLALGRQPYLPWWGKMNEEDQELIASVAKQLQLLPFLEKNCNQISDGQLQKVLLGRALVQNTPLVLLDEPTTHLDLEHKAELFLLLKKLVQTDHKSILFSTHDIEWALQVADRIWLIDGENNPCVTPSEFVKSGALDDLFSAGFVRFDPQDQRFQLQQNRYL